LQQCKSEYEIRTGIVTTSIFVTIFVDGWNALTRPRVDEPRFSIPQMKMTGFNRLATCGMIMAIDHTIP